MQVETIAFAGAEKVAQRFPEDGVCDAGEASGAAAVMLRAIAAMARISNRQQAELGVALQRAGVALPPLHQAAGLRLLCDAASIEDVIPLSDGGVLLSVTAAGMERALR